ncbi:solute carrier family 12 member 3-like isoform X2 [Betta splendens]|uniref:Solute carrier family 12 member 3-like isoform X2 n=1 Tax=Betta splendens TaxID=158456 RepID=A0A6P7P0A3_BETSP|nr:solute carrier family 12 member 3-like isoform X2 [Betta splendens]
MGQLASRRNGASAGIFPDAHTSSSMEEPPSVAELPGKMEMQKSSLYRTLDRVPQLEHYSNSLPRRQAKARPTLAALRKTFKEMEEEKPPITDGENEDSNEKKPEPVKLGWVLGVQIRCMLNIWGVIMFLRLTWITSQAGIVLTWVMVFLSVTVTITTVLAISAIATNGKTVSGGPYFMVARSLGPEVGGPIGLIFAIANALSSALNAVGFAEVVSQLLTSYGTKIVDPVNDVRIVGVITITLLLLISLAGMEWESKTQMLFFIALMISFIGYTVGTIIPQTVVKQSQGIFGYKSEIFVANLVPDFRGGNNFFSMFAIFFPATNGILTGVNISGDLKDPNRGIPRGTLLAVFWTTLTYLALPITVGACVVRDASGNITDKIPANSTGPCVSLACDLGWNFTNCIEEQTCANGLANDLQVLGEVSVAFHLITLGVFAASLSSALSYLVSAPKIFQCLCRDDIYPYIRWFEKGYGKSDEPLRAYILTYIICVAFICIAQLDIIAALISNFFLCSYALINFTCFHAKITNSPGWRPTFKYYNNLICIYGALSSLILMFLLTWWAALVTIVVVILLLLYSSYKKPNVNWGSTLQAQTYNMALSYSVSLSRVQDHVKNYRPQCLVLTGSPQQRPALVDFVGCFTKNTSLMICGDIIMEERKPQPSDTTEWLLKWMNQRKVRSFYTPFKANSLRIGTRTLLQAAGLGKLKPNTLVIGFKSNWKECPAESLDDYVNTINDTFDTNYSLCILRMMDGLDMFDLDCEVNQAFEFDDAEDNPPPPDMVTAEGTTDKSESDPIKTVFQNDQGKKNIDIYWIADDGGLTLLLPYLLTRRKHWRKCKVRVFIVGDEQNMEEQQKAMTDLLEKFRLEFEEVIVMTDTEKNPQTKNLNRFVDSVTSFRVFDEQKESASVQELGQSAPWEITDNQFDALKLKSERKVRLNEIIRRHSQNAAILFVTLPVPQRDCPSSLYMAWLDALTCGIHCPVVLIRGNQQNVLTYYCE